MQYIHGTVDSHQCFQCGITVSNFVENDTLLGEHIHHSNGSCPYIAREFKNQKGELDAIMGKERYRRGHIAIPDLAIQAHYGRIGSRGARSCVICSAIERTHLPANGHYSYCDAMKECLNDFTGLVKPTWDESKALSTMKRVVADLLEKYRCKYNGLVKLALEHWTRNDDMGFVSKIATNIFNDGTRNWGRIASLIAFGAALCQHFNEIGREDCVALVGEEISLYLLTAHMDWLIRNDSWNGFVEFFRLPDQESTLTNILLTTAGFAGIGAALTLLIK
ncbi:induced myeloid leukemia cell differentiation protein Mcl-1 homolog [Perca fluviatilis]|uniref:induced myeloid leukemia cell differentiation protein Mcl-1 homolog n=1 Tax=Perca fluviatilis TaxID=8168 RepID=UPI0019637E1F|nr:induced myeloid leukemia cell differentiation protein Mcl-1 homolog [Perca fluviatilis]